jgi:hypothetical protein
MERIVDEYGWELIDTVDSTELWRDPCGGFYSVSIPTRRAGRAFLSEDAARAYMASYIKRRRYRSKVGNNATT